MFNTYDKVGAFQLEVGMERFPLSCWCGWYINNAILVHRFIPFIFVQPSNRDLKIVGKRRDISYLGT